ncbi:MAG: T9SS type A sorting domain-containing protein [Prolixibacteraceae bacterium]|nr:T9SS type A sorting domain-containing protein [Prolixibacteraceae bacterium]
MKINCFAYLICIIVLMVSLENVNAQEKYVLNEGEIPGYKIILQRKIDIYNYIAQTWENTDNGEQITIRYFEHENEEVAIAGLPFSIGSVAVYYNFGSYSGEIAGNVSWGYRGNESFGLFFQKWNVVIFLFSSGTLTPTDMLNLGNKIMDKINEHIPPEYLVKDQELKMGQIPEPEYNQLTERGIEILSANNYTENKTEDTKWGLASDSIVMGMRKQWSTDKSFFAIDIVKLSNKEDAELAGTKRDSMTWSPFCRLNNRESVEQAVAKAVERGVKTKEFVSVTGVTGNYAIHFYYHHTDSVDIDFFKSVLFTFDDNSGTILNKLNDINVYPNPAKETFTIEPQNPETAFGKLYNLNGVLIKNLTVQQGINSYNISDLKSGVYFIQVQQKEGEIVRKLVKQ